MFLFILALVFEYGKPKFYQMMLEKVKVQNFGIRFNLDNMLGCRVLYASRFLLNTVY